MAVFKNEDEVYAYMAGIFRRGLEIEGLADKLAGSGVVLRVYYTDPDAVVTVDMPNKVVETGASSTAVPHVELFMRSEERRVGKECIRTGRCRWAPIRLKNKT